MSRLQAVHIKRFKSIWDQRIELGQLNVFIGLNGAGKSNILEALGMLSTALSGTIEYDRLAYRGVRLSVPGVFKSSFKNRKRPISLDLTAKWQLLSYNTNISSGEKERWYYHSEALRNNKNRSIAGRSNKISTVGKRKVQVDHNHGIVPIVETDSDAMNPKELETIKALKEFAIFAPATPILRGISPDNSQRSPLGLYGGSLATALMDLFEAHNQSRLLNTVASRMRNMFNWLESIGAGSPDSTIQSKHIHTGHTVVTFSDTFMETNFNRLTAYDVSEGVLYVLFTMVLLTHPDAPPMFALDSVDSAMNPGLVRQMIAQMGKELQNQPEKQVFLTTHNPTTLDALDLFNDDHRLFVVKRGPKGDTVVKRIAPPEGMTRDKWADHVQYLKLSEIWLDGWLDGALPPPEGF